MSRSELLAGGRDPTDSFFHCDGIPRLTNAVAINQTGGEIGGHLRWRQRDDAHLFIRLDATALEPAAEQKMMRGVT